jgi:hypothetical protein
MHVEAQSGVLALNLFVEVSIKRINQLVTVQRDGMQAGTSRAPANTQCTFCHNCKHA